MTHIAIQEALNGKPVDWMEKVSDEQYRRKAETRIPELKKKSSRLRLPAKTHTDVLRLDCFKQSS